MVRSLSHTAYMAYARHVSSELPRPDKPRPPGEVIWAHAADEMRALALCQIAERLVSQRPGLHMLLTAPADVPRPDRPCPAVFWTSTPNDTVAASEAFLNHWAPDICLWTGGDLRPALLTCADDRNVPMYLIDADEGQLSKPGWRWFPDLPRSLLKRFAQIQARSEGAARTLRRIGVADDDISVTGALRPEAVPLAYNDNDREEMAQILRGRPVWLVARALPEELDTILKARQTVSRLSHRLVLIIAPVAPDSMAGIRARLEADGLRVAHWDNGDMPEETTQVILSEDPSELGLWYRLAPLTFLGSSLHSGMQGHDPNEPAVHGSALLYGPNVRRFLPEYSRFADAGAARIVRDAETMAAAVQHLIAPDNAAMMAHAAWDVASQAAEVTDRVLDLVQDTLDVMGAR